MKIKDLFEKWQLTGLKVKTPILEMDWNRTIRVTRSQAGNQEKLYTHTSYVKTTLFINSERALSRRHHVLI